jgi:hypothetical protein
MTFHEWLQAGIDNGYCTKPVCSTHDGLPLTPQEEANYEDDGYTDDCIPAVRLLDQD